MEKNQAQKYWIIGLFTMMIIQLRGESGSLNIDFTSLWAHF